MQLLTRPLFVLVATLLATISNNVSAATQADVIVYGSTPGGFCAAIAAAREGASVILLEPTDHVGAMSTGGLSHCDSNQMVRSTLMGLFDEWHTRVIKDYTDRVLKAPYNSAKKDQSRWTFGAIHACLRSGAKMEAGVILPQNLEQPLTIDNLARQAALSRSRLKARFKTEVGIPPVDYVMRKQIERAQVLLLDGDHNVTNVAFRLNFSTSQYFATVFKRYTGQTPSGFRAAARRSNER